MNHYAQALFVSNPLREPTLLAALKALSLPQGSVGLDVGCGIGLQALRLPEAVGPRGHIIGLDASADFVTLAEQQAEQAGLSQRVSFRQGDWNKLPFDDRSFDWVWSADGVGYSTQEPLREVTELTRVVKPGGSVAILMWSSQVLLPGYPALEARLNATRAGIAPFTTAMSPDSHFLRALGWLHAAGLENVCAQTFVRSVFAPLPDDLRDALTALIEMRWGGAESELSEQDKTAFRQLCQHDSPEFVLDRPDYYAFFTYSLFYGTVHNQG